MNFHKIVLFTGAGYTANFGGFLAREMWSRIFNNPKMHSAGTVKLKLKENFDFEQLYSDILDERSIVPEPEGVLFREAVDEAFEAMDMVIQTGWDSIPFNHTGLVEFLDKFIKPSEDSNGVCFTLNQDLVMEKRFGWKPLGPDFMVGRANWGEVGKPSNTWVENILPTYDELQEFKTQLTPRASYIKLHGSMGWIKPDGEDTKVIGINKIGTIMQIDLLQWYIDLFKDAINQGGVKLVIMGYGFRDSHINQLLAYASENSGLKLYIINPNDPEKFKDNLLFVNQGILKDPNPVGLKIWKGIEGYFPYKLTQIFPAGRTEITPELAEIYRAVGFSEQN